MALFAFFLPSICRVKVLGSISNHILLFQVSRLCRQDMWTESNSTYTCRTGLVWPWVRSCNLVVRSFMKACLASLTFSTLFYNGTRQFRQFSSQTSVWSYLSRWLWSACKSDQWPLVNVISSHIGSRVFFLSVAPYMKEIELCRRFYCARLVKTRPLISMLAFGYHLTWMSSDFRSYFDFDIKYMFHASYQENHDGVRIIALPFFFVQ